MAEADPAGPADAADADMLTSLTLLWPGYFAQPGTAPAIPPGLRASMAGYVGTFVSMSEHLADGSLASALRQLRVPAIFLLGAQSPMPVSQGEQAAGVTGGDRLRVPVTGDGARSDEAERGDRLRRFVH